MNGAVVFESNRAADVSYCPARSQGDELFVLFSGHSDPTQLTCTSQRDEHPFVSPDGSLVVFASTRVSSNPQLFTVPVDSANGSSPITPKLVSGDRDAADTYPSWSPKGDGTIVFARARPGQLFQLFIENVGSPAGAIPVFSSPTGFVDTQPAFDPSDADHVVFVRLVGNHTQIMSYDLKTRVLVNLSAQGDGGVTSNDAKPDFAPLDGGQRLVFQSDRACGTTQLYTMTQQGTHQVPVFQTLDHSKPTGVQMCTDDTRNPVFSPHGDALAFDRSDPSAGGVRHTYAVDINADAVAVTLAARLNDNAARTTEPNWGPVSEPPVQLPETPYPIVLPVAGCAVGVSVWLLRRRRTRGAAT
jgi:Tol biopolymer transport system component